MSVWMLVEDEPLVHEILLTMFQIWGVDGIAFADGVETIAWLESVDRGDHTDPLPDLALVDIRLPKISGLEVASRLRRSRVLYDIPIVLMTAYRLKPSEESEVLYLSQANRVLYKPLPPLMELRAILNNLVAAHSSHA